MTQTNPFVQVHVVSVRSTLGQRVGGGSRMDLIELTDKIERKNSGNTAHEIEI